MFTLNICLLSKHLCGREQVIAILTSHLLRVGRERRETQQQLQKDTEDGSKSLDCEVHSGLYLRARHLSDLS
jgi:hypothetical protein